MSAPGPFAAPRRRAPGISLTPLVDVVFILLVFFMLATSFDAEAQLPVSLAEGGGPAGSVLVSRAEARAGGIALGPGPALTPPAAAAALRARAAAHDGPHLVRLAPGPGTPLQSFVSALETLRAAGVGRVEAARP